MVLPITRLAADGIQRHSLHEPAEKLFSEAGFRFFLKDDFDSPKQVFTECGFHFLKKHYYLPIPQEEDLDEAFWNEQSQLVGVDMNDSGALDFLRKIFPLYVEEFRASFPLHSTSDDPAQFHLINGTFMAIDAHVYYFFIRHFQPNRIVEIGSGKSTLVAAAAGNRNLAERGYGPKLTTIDPFPSEFLKDGFPGLDRVIGKKLQDIDLDEFSSLESGDILFIDSTHVLRAGGDVQREYCEILPRLAPGVIVHIHDISLPKPYPRIYFEKEYYWNEQYLLQAFLSFNSKFEVMWPANYMMLKYPKEVSAVFPEHKIMRESFPMSEPSSFWMRVKP